MELSISTITSLSASMKPVAPLVYTIKVLILYHGVYRTTSENETNQTTNWSPSTMGEVTVDCGDVEIDPDNLQEISCTITNPNNYSITISLEPEGGWSEWSNFITFAPSSGEEEIMIEEFANKAIAIGTIEFATLNFLIKSSSEL